MTRTRNGLQKAKWIIALMTVVVLVLLLASQFYFRLVRNEEKNQQYKLLSTIAAFKVNEISKWLLERKAEGVFFSSSPSFVAMMDELNAHPSSTATVDAMKSWLIPVKENHLYKRVSVFDPSGILLFEIGRKSTSGQGSAHTKKLMSHDAIQFSQIKKEPGNNDLILDLIVPVHQKTRLLGWLVFSIDPAEHLFPLIESYPVRRLSAINFLAQYSGDSVLTFPSEATPATHGDPSRYLSGNDTLAKTVPLSGTFTRVEIRDSRGVNVLADVRVIPGTRWNLISRIDMDEVLQPLRKRAFNIFIYMLTFLSLIGISLLLIWKNQQLQQFRSQLELEQKATRVQEKVEFMNALIEEVNDAIITFDKDMIIRSWNKGAEKIYGWKAEDMVGKFGGGSLSHCFLGASVSEISKEINQSGVWKGEIVHKRKDGSVLCLLSSTSQHVDQSGKVLGIMTINKDITEVVQAEKIRNAVYRISELAHASRDLQEMFTSIHVVIEELMDARNFYIALIESDGKTISFPYFVDEKDTPPPSSPMGNGLTEFVLKTGKPLLAKPEDIRYYIDRGVIDMMGSPSVDWLGIPLRSENETFGVLVVQSYDPKIRYGDNDKNILTFVSEQIALSIQRKKIQQELVDAKEKAEGSNKLTSSLLANMNHELRTPMNGILGFAEILCNDLAETELKSKAENILQSGHRLMNTLDAIMDLSYLESEKVSRKFQSVAVAGVVEAVCRGYERDIALKKLELEKEIPSDLAINGDEHLFHHLVRILTDNAVKYTHHGSIRITAGSFFRNDIEYIALVIKDTGIGISPEYHKLIFDPFRQVSEGYSRQFEGSGLGLTIAKKIVDLLQGEISLKSTLGEGSEFTVLLPSATRPSLVSVPDLTMGKKQPRTKKLPDILIVEDNIVNVQLLMIYLRKYCNIYTTIDAASAIELAKRQKFDAVFMDINLGPGMDGIQAMIAIHALPGNQSIPVIAVTGYASFGDHERLIQAGFTEYIPKPFDRETIADLMNKLFPRG